MAVLQLVFASYGEKILSVKKQIGIGLFISGISLIVFPFFKNEFVVYGLIVVFAAGGAVWCSPARGRRAVNPVDARSTRGRFCPGARGE